MHNQEIRDTEQYLKKHWQKNISNQIKGIKALIQEAI